MNVEGKVAFITGSADGIGRAIAEALCEAGARVIMADIDEKRLQQAVELVRTKAARQGTERVSGCVLDVSDGKQVKQAIEESVGKFGGIDILVNCAGVINSHPLLELSEADWDRIMDVNLKGMFLVTKNVFANMVARKQGKIVNIGSDLSSNGQRFLAHYCASKHGVIGFTRSVALEAAEYDILVNAVCPGPTETKLHFQDIGFQTSYTGISEKEHLAKELASIPLKKLGKPREVARMVLFLVSEENTHITGEAINVCGGVVMH